MVAAQIKHLYLYLYSYLYLLRYPFVFVGGDNGGRPDKVVEQLFNKLQTRDQGPCVPKYFRWHHYDDNAPDHRDNGRDCDMIVIMMMMMMAMMLMMCAKVL